MMSLICKIEAKRIYAELPTQVADRFNHLQPLHRVELDIDGRNVISASDLLVVRIGGRRFTICYTCSETWHGEYKVASADLTTARQLRISCSGEGSAQLPQERPTKRLRKDRQAPSNGLVVPASANHTSSAPHEQSEVVIIDDDDDQVEAPGTNSAHGDASCSLPSPGRAAAGRTDPVASFNGHISGKCNMIVSVRQHSV
jgi:hypothetical protein